MNVTSTAQAAPSVPAIVFGASGHALAVVDVLRRAGWTIAALVDPSTEIASDASTPLLHSDVEGRQAALDRVLPAVVALGDNERRLALVRWLLAAGVELPVVVARTATVAADAILQPGTVVMEHAHIGPRSRLGMGCLVNTHAVVEHEVMLGDGVHIAPGALLGGGVRCGEQTLVGTGAAVLPLSRVGAGAIVGAGAVVTTSINAGATVVGVPARSITA